MARVRIKDLDSLFVLRHTQRADKLATTISSIDFEYNHHHQLHDTFNPPLATFHATNNKSNNGYTQARELGAKVLNYVSKHTTGSPIVLRFHTSPYLRCIETVKYMVDHIVKHHEDHTRQIRIVISLDQVLSEWLNTELDVNYYPPNDNGAFLLSTAVQYLSSNIPFNRNDAVSITLNLNNSYKHGNPGPFSETLLQQFTRLNRGVISIVKDAHNTLTPGQDSKDIVLLMTHGACVRTIVSKLMGKSLMVEIPLASATLVKPQGSEGRQYLWKVQETDIELRKDNNNNIKNKNINTSNNTPFKSIDIYSSRDPFQDIQTTFNASLSSQLDFKSHVPLSKSENYNRMRSQSLLNPSKASHHDSDSEDDSDDEGISFNVNPSRRASSAHNDNSNSRRFRSASLFGPTLNNPFFDESNNNRSSSRKNSFERVKASLRLGEEAMSAERSVSPKENVIIRPTATRPLIYNFSPALSGNNTPQITPTNSAVKIAIPSPLPSSSNVKVYQNIDEDDGIHEIPELMEQSSNNSSIVSLHDESHKHTDDSTSAATNASSTHSLETFTSIPTAMKDDGTTPMSSTVSLDTIKPVESGASSSLFDKSLIEESLREIHQDSSSFTPFAMNDWMTFKNDNSSSFKKKNDESLEAGKNKFKIDLYGKKNRNYKLNLYDDNSDEYDEGENDNNGSGGGGGWFLGSNRF